MAGCIQMEVGLSPGDFVLDGDQLPSPKRGQSPQFSAHVYCGQTAGWIKMLLGTELGLGADDIVLDGTQLPPLPKRGTASPIFGLCLLWPNGCMYQDTTWYGGRPQPRRYCVRWGHSSPPLKGHSPLSIFGQCPSWPNGWMD